MMCFIHCVSLYQVKRSMPIVLVSHDNSLMLYYGLWTSPQTYKKNLRPTYQILSMTNSQRYLCSTSCPLLFSCVLSLYCISCELSIATELTKPSSKFVTPSVPSAALNRSYAQTPIKSKCNPSHLRRRGRAKWSFCGRQS